MSTFVGFKGMCSDCAQREGKKNGYCLEYDNACKAVAHNCHRGPFEKPSRAERAVLTPTKEEK